MIDVLLIAELSWCTLWMRTQGVRKSVLYAGGILSAGYVASQMSEWISRTFMAPSTKAFLWVQNHLVSDATAVSVLAQWIPPEPAWSGLNHSSWVALHLIRGIVSVAVTLAIFSAFLIVGYVADALWDRNHVFQAQKNHWVNWLLGLGCGLYCMALTVTLLKSLAWIQWFPMLYQGISSSLVIHGFTYMEQVLPQP